MATKPTLEETIEVASRMKECLQSIYSTYERIPMVIKKEHAAIKTSKIEEVEKVAEEKIVLGNEVDRLFVDLRNHSHQLADIYEAVCGENSLRNDNMSDCIKMFESIAGNFKERGFGAQVFDHVLAGFREVFERFLVLKQSVRPEIEKNKYVLSKLLFQRQENYRFWQEVVMESMAAYNKEGKHKAKRGQQSIVAVKA